MSKAFDTVTRSKLMEKLHEIIDDDEMYLLDLLINEVKYKVKIGKNEGTEFKTEIGIAQGDCLSAVLFIYYLAFALSEKKEHQQLIDHNYNLPIERKPDNKYKIQWSELDFLIPEERVDFEINPCYADDTTWATTLRQRLEQVKQETPNLLKNYNLMTNKEKTEQFTIERNGETDWKKCKLLGSLLDTESDINRRTLLAITAYNKLNYIFKSNNVSNKIKIRIYNAYILPILTYNCEIWTLTETLSEKVNTFHRKQLRRIIKSRWQRKMKNEKLYEYTKTKELTIYVRKRRLSWFGHLMRLHPDTPARKSLKEFLRPVPRPVGRPPKTYIETINKDITKIAQNLGYEIDIKKQWKETLTLLESICSDRDSWRRQIENLMS